MKQGTQTTQGAQTRYQVTHMMRKVFKPRLYSNDTLVDSFDTQNERTHTRYLNDTRCLNGTQETQMKQRTYMARKVLK